MQQTIKYFFSPVAFAIGFIWPLTVQVLNGLAVTTPGWQTWLIAFAAVMPFALMAQIRGSWIWIK